MLSVNYMEVCSIVLEHIQRRICHHVLLFEEGTSKSSFVTERRDRVDVRCCKQLDKYDGQAPFIDL